MKNTFMVIPFVFSFCFAVGCLQRGEVAEEPAADVEADIQAINRIEVDYGDALNSADLDKVMSIYADDAVVIPPNEAVITGNEALRNLYQQIFNEFTVQRNYVLEDVKVSGNLAVVYDTYSVIDTPKIGGEPIIVPGITIMVLKKQPNDAWKIVYQIWNDERLIYPTQEE